LLSDDGEKVVFYRGKMLEHHNSIFSVNADGSQMREITTTAWLDTLGAGTKAGHLAFVPNTHQILFNRTYAKRYPPSLPNYQLPIVVISECNGKGVADIGAHLNFAPLGC
jgi:hypothetical protein